MNKNALAYLMRHPPIPCPVKGFPLALQDLTVDGVEQYSLVISVQDFADCSNPLGLAQWLNDVLLPAMNHYAPVSISKISESLTAIDGWGTLE